VNIERAVYAPAMSDLETALRQIIAEVVREELHAILGRRGAQMESDGGRRYVSPAQAAAIASVSTRTIHTWVRQGRLPAFRPGRLLRVAVDDLHACMATKPPESSLSPKELADLKFAEWREQDKTRCPDCGHLPMWHTRGRCRAKNCRCVRRMA
jgi:excisionase family DNA binding protein